MSDKSPGGKKDGDIADKILRRIITDAAFRQQVAENPFKALTDAGYTRGEEVKEHMPITDVGADPATTEEPDADKPQATAPTTDKPNFQRHLIEKPWRRGPGPRKNSHRGPDGGGHGRRAVK